MSGLPMAWMKDGRAVRRAWWPERRRLRHALANALAANAELLRDRRELELAFDSVPSILVAFSPKGDILHWNAAAERTFGLTFEQVRHRRLSACGIDWSEPPRVLDGMFERCQDGYRSDHPFQLAGQKRWLGISLRQVQHGDESPSFLLTASDITERREVEEQSRQTHKLEAIGQLAAGIAHEINTPTQYVGDNLTFLRDAWSDLAQVFATVADLRAQASTEPAFARLNEQYDAAVERADLSFLLLEFPQALAQALEGSQRIAHIVRAMKEFSHPGSVDKTELDLNHAVETTVTIARSEWKYVADVVTDFEEDLPRVACYPGEISQVILNLLVNAAHAIQDRLAATPELERGTITLQTRRKDNAVELRVTDTGMGIADDIKPRIFELFFTTKEVGKGTGQGLAFAHAVIVKKHGGDLWCDSDLGVGTTFGFRLHL